MRVLQCHDRHALVTGVDPIGSDAGDPGQPVVQRRAESTAAPAMHESHRRDIFERGSVQGFLHPDKRLGDGEPVEVDFTSRGRRWGGDFRRLCRRRSPAARRRDRRGVGCGDNDGQPCDFDAKAVMGSQFANHPNAESRLDSFAWDESIRDACAQENSDWPAACAAWTDSLVKQEFTGMSIRLRRMHGSPLAQPLDAWMQAYRKPARISAPSRRNSSRPRRA